LIFYEPIKIALDFLDKTTPPGAMILVDDYDFFSTGAKAAVDEFLAEKNSNKMVYDCFIPDKEYGYFAVLSKKS
jgi:O-methyltransferase